MPVIDQDAIADTRAALKAEIADLQAQLKTKKALYSEWNKVSALLGGDAPGTLTCKRRGCTRAKPFTTKAGLSRHMSQTHGAKK